MPDPRGTPVNPKGILAREWTRFSHKVLDPIGASSIQRAEMRRAFYAGAAVMFDSLANLAGPDDEPDEAGVERFNIVSEEIQQFAKDLAEGRA